MSNASDPLQNNRKAFFIYIIMYFNKNLQIEDLENEEYEEIEDHEYEDERKEACKKVGASLGRSGL